MADIGSSYDSVRNVYDQYRTVMLNRKYYGCRLDTIMAWNSAFEISIAVGTSSALVGWSIWKTPVGAQIWTVLGIVVALLAIVKPLLQYSKQIERYTKLFTGYGDIYYDLELLVDQIGRKQAYDDEMDSSYCKIIDRLKKYVGDDDPRPDKKLIHRCTEEVNREKPANRFWWPKRTGE